ncbi:MAG: serine O-acetyltransferase EpsC [Balneolaceae bacterium]
MTDINSFIKELTQAHRDVSKCPPPEMVISFFEDLLGMLFPEFSYDRHPQESAIRSKMEHCRSELQRILEHNEDCVQSGITVLDETFFNKLPEIRSLLLQDIEAIFMGDPAAKSKAEVIRTYPGFYAMAAHRIAHELLKLGVNLIPRIISEYAHRQTGIDIHPGAEIGNHFCIDHGTGVVIGETTKIGSYVKIYQGVTLGGLSVRKEDAKIKRHPTIEDRVVIYSGATILGGNTVIGEGSIIGGNVWLTHSVPPGSKIYYQAKMTNAEGETDTITYK